MANFGRIRNPIAGGTGKPPPLKFVAIRNVSSTAEERLDQSFLFAQEQPHSAGCRHHLARFGKGVQRKLRRHQVNGCAWMKRAAKLVDHTFVTAVPQQFHILPPSAFSTRADTSREMPTRSFVNAATDARTCLTLTVVIATIGRWKPKGLRDSAKEQMTVSADVRAGSRILVPNHFHQRLGQPLRGAKVEGTFYEMRSPQQAAQGAAWG